MHKKNMLNRIKSFITEGNQRSIKAKKNIIGMLFIKGGNILIGLLLVPLTLGYVDKECYGIWLTLSSMVVWIHFFDIGISNGLRNRLTEALSDGNYDLCQKYVSTTYAMLSLIFVPLMMILLIIIPYINWTSLLNISSSLSEGLVTAISIIVIYFCLSFILNTINTVILAEQRPADASLRGFISQLVSLATIYVLTKYTEGNIVYLCLGLCFAPLLVILLFNVTLFTGRYKHMKPVFDKVDFSLLPNLLKLGVQFFIIQIASVVQFQAINFIILRYYGAAEVTSYNIAYKYFSVLTMIWGIVTTPIWSATTDAFTKGDYSWISNILKKYTKLFGITAIIGVIMLFVSPFIYNIWIGNKVEVPFVLSFWILLNSLVIMYGTSFVMVVNGSGQLKIQTYASIISPLVFIGCCSLFISLGWGIHSILISAIISNFNAFLLAPMQCVSLLKNKK